MAKDRIEIDGETFGWLPESAKRGVGSLPGRFRVFWHQGGDASRRVLIGRLCRWGGAGWTVHPRIGGRRRAQEAGMGYAETRAVGVGRLVALAKAEADLRMVDKIRLGIVQDRGDGPVDLSDGIEPITDGRGGAAP